VAEVAVSRDMAGQPSQPSLLKGQHMHTGQLFRPLRHGGSEFAFLTDLLTLRQLPEACR
jgi:hypothetical protein